MCSIPGLPTPGSQMPVLISRINLNPNCGLVELWVNINHERKHIYEQMRKDIQIPKRGFDRAKGKPGDLCLVCISDTWHRARIVSIQNETYNVFLIDQGQPHITTSEALAWGQSDSFLLPPETESCILANVHSVEKSWPEKATKFLVSLPGKKFEGKVQGVLMPDRIILLDIPIVSKHMYKCGVAKKIPADEFKCHVLKCLNLPKGEDSEVSHITQEQKLNVSCQLEKNGQYFYPELLTSAFETVNVTEVIDPQNIFCKLQILSKAVAILSEQIRKHYEETSHLGEAQPQTCGTPCAARGMNSRWHRSLLKQNMTSDGGAVEVFHVDEGTTELVPAENIKPLHAKFLRMPVVTYHCSLEGVKDNGTGWTTDQTDYLKSLLLHQTVVARFDHYNISQHVYHVTLYAANALCINSCFKGKAGLSKTEQDSNGSIPSPLLSSVGDEQCIDVWKDELNIGRDGLQEETRQSTKNLAVNGKTDDAHTDADEIHIKYGSEHPQPLAQSSQHLSAGFPCEMQNVHDDDALTVGSSVSVNVSCIESLQKFWCQTTENADSLRLLMKNLQKYYASTHPQSLVESVCVARNPDNGMWYRARILASQCSPFVDVRFIDYGQTQKVPLQDVRPIDPAFLRLNAQAFQCCLFNPTNPPAITSTDAVLAEFQEFVDLSASSNIELKCIVKAVVSDEEGLLLNVVDIETSSDSSCKHLAQTCAEDEAHVQIPLQVPSDAYSYPRYNIEVGGKEKVWVTSSENITTFYCQLDRNSHLVEKVMENVQQLIGQPECSDHPLGLNSICFARYTDNHWYRGQIVETATKLRVHLIDYGHTITVEESDICPIPAEASIARSVSAQALSFELFDVPTEVPEEVNQWFADNVIGQCLTMSVVAKGTEGKLIVELFDGSLNLNGKVRERISQMTQQKMTDPVQQVDQSLPNEDFSAQELTNVSRKMTEKNEVHSSNGTCIRDELNMSLQSTTLSAPEKEHEKTSDEGGRPALNVNHEDKESVLAETFIQGGHSDSEMSKLFPHSSPEGNVNICMYKEPNISLNKMEEVYASCIVGPHFFWCQYANTEDLIKVSKLAQEAGRAHQDIMFPKSLRPGSPCLALFSSDQQWYRAQVIRRVDNGTFCVVFIDYGNESDVDIENVKPLPQSLLDKAPQAFLCSLNGFDESKGSWDDEIYDDFYNLLVDKPLRVTVFNIKAHSEIVVPQYAVQIQCETMIVNDAVQEYWKPAATQHVMMENPQMENLLQCGQIESNMTDLSVSKGYINSCMYKEPKMYKNKTEMVYASCIVGPHFFWCQYANSDDLAKVSRLAQEAGQDQKDVVLPKTLGPGSPCLALFSSDEQWYRAQVLRRIDDGTYCVVFIDYGNESDIDIKNIKPLPQNLLDKAPQAFLCSLNGFDESKGSWDDEIYDDFYNLLVDKPLRVTVLNIEDNSEIAIPQYAVEIECDGVVINAAIQKYWKPVAAEHVLIEHSQTETFLQCVQTGSNMAHLSVSTGNVNTCIYKEPKVSKNQTEMVYASCIVGPNFFWCQFANTENLTKVSRLAQEAGQDQKDTMFPKALGPGSPCLALFSSDEQWYRAQVIHRVDNALKVVFIDYGNESDVDIKNVKPLTQSLLDKAPQAFLCSLNGFDESMGSWNDEIYDDFYNLLVDKPLRVTVFNMEDNSEIAVPQYAVEIECDGVLVNTLMEKYWKGLDTDHALAESLGSVDDGDYQDDEECSTLDPDKCPCGSQIVREES